MENYESLGTIGEGTYGVVLKCRHKVTGQIVAIKKFKESDDDELVKKTALREIKILKQLRHENIVNLLEFFRLKGKLYLVFEFVEKTILEEIERHPDGLDPFTLKKLMWQLVRAITFCHQHNIIHRDIKPENLLVSRNGVLKLCDFGFARPLASVGAKYTEYVSTRWYRAPELLVGDVSYGKAVDVWSIGCMFAEIATGLPLFPGDSDIDQLSQIIRCLGHITSRQQDLFRKNELYVGVKLPQANDLEPLEARFPTMDKVSLDFVRRTIVDEPLDRWTCVELLKHPFFGSSHETFERELQEAIARDLSDTAAVRKKRARQPSRGKNVAGSVLLVSPNSTGSMDKTVNVGLSNSIEKYVESRKEETKLTIGSKGQVVPSMTPLSLENDAFHLPALQGMINMSYNTNSTASSTSTALHVATSSCGSTGHISPLLHRNKKLFVPPSILETKTFGSSVRTKPLTYITSHEKDRSAVVTYGGHLAEAGDIAIYPYTSTSPSTLSNSKSSHGSRQNLFKPGSDKTGSVHSVGLTQTIPKDLHSSKKVAKKLNHSFGHDTGWNGLRKGSCTNSRDKLMPRATPPQLRLHVPPRTSPLQATTIQKGSRVLIQRKK
ncbi:putative protein kinase [Plasmopara halstedii]